MRTGKIAEKGSVGKCSNILGYIALPFEYRFKKMSPPDLFLALVDYSDPGFFYIGTLPTKKTDKNKSDKSNHKTKNMHQRYI